MMNKRTVAAALSLFLLSSLNAETFRTRKVHKIDVDIQTTFEDNNLQLGINDSLAIFLPEDKTFLEGIEIKMTIPQEIASWRDSVACTLYNNIEPEPKAEQIDYSGTRLFVRTLPGKLSWTLQVPLIPRSSIKENQYSTKVDSIPNIDRNFLFLRFQPVMKGMAEETLNAVISISVRPILKDLGKLNLSFNYPDSEKNPVTVFIDDKTTDLSDIYLLKTGIHSISVVSENYRNEVRTCYIEQAKTTDLLIDLKSVEPALIISLPNGAKAWLDGELCKKLNTEFPITEGEHIIKVSFGEYEMTRTINAVKGKTYNANFEVDFTITDSEE